MNIKVKFLGASKTVTGSKFLLDLDGYHLMIDCGLFQGIRELRERNWDEFPTDAAKIDAIVLTHAHIDHSGYLPRLVNEGFNGPVYCTEATGDLLEIMLLDAAKLQEEEADWARKKGYSRHRDPQPLFKTEDAKKALSMLVSNGYGSAVRINDSITATFSDAGHILGSSFVTIEVQGDHQAKKIVFSGDIGPKFQPLLKAPKKLKEADILFVESTYGNRQVIDRDPKVELAAVINETMDNKGCLLIPAFAVGKTQSLLFYLKELFDQGAIPDIPVYIDSPMAISATELYRKHQYCNPKGDCPPQSVFDFKNFHYMRDQKASVSLNKLKKDAIIISASGMCTGGRILHHLYHRLPRPHDTILFVGFQAEGTRGRKLVEGDESVNIFGLPVPVASNIRNIIGLSAHGDKDELLEWMKGVEEPPKRTFVVHGEATSSYHFARAIRRMGWSNVIVPEYLESFLLFDNI